MLSRSSARLVASSIVVLSSVAVAAKGDIVVSSMPDWDGVFGIQFVPGAVSTHSFTVGQTFTAPADATALDGFSLHAFATLNPISNMRAYLFTATGGQATGVPLYRSDSLATLGYNGGVYTHLDFSSINAPVIAGQTYVILLSCTEGGPTDTINRIQLAAPRLNSSSPLLGNAISFFAADNSAAGLTGQNFSNVNNALDLAVELRFIPTPGGAALLAALGLAGAARRR